MPGEQFHGRISFVAVLPDQNSWWANPNLRLYKTEVAIDDATSEMRPGMSVSIEILVEEIDDTLYVPLQAVNHRRGENVCYVTNGGRPEPRVVEVRQSNAAWVAIASGLKEGETVLLSPPPEALEVQDDKEPEDAAEGERTGARPGKRSTGAGHDGSKPKGGARKGTETAGGAAASPKKPGTGGGKPKASDGSSSHGGASL